MKITKLTYKDGTKLSQKSLESVADRIVACAAAKGFITAAEVLNSSAIKVGLHMRSFAIDVNKLGYNARFGMGVPSNSSKGYKRTDVPVWRQREDFNHLINDILDSLNMTANIKSGAYIVRNKKTGRVNEWECISYHGQTAEPDRVYDAFGNLLIGMCREKDIKEHVDVNKFKDEYSVRAKEQARAAAEARKQRLEVLRASETVFIKDVHWSLRNSYKKHLSKAFSQAEWLKFLNKLPKEHKRHFVWETEAEHYMRILHE